MELTGALGNWLMKKKYFPFLLDSVTRFFASVFSWITFPQAPENNSRVISNFFENSRRYSQVKVHQLCQRHWSQICHRCQWQRWQNCRRYQRHRRQICHRYQQHWRQILNFAPVPIMLLTPMANFPPVSTIPAANLPPVANCHRYQRHRWQLMGTI